MALPDLQDEAHLPRRIVMLAFDGLTLFNLAMPHEAFAAVEIARAEQRRPRVYSVTVASAGGNGATGWSGLSIATGDLPEISDIDTLIVPGAMELDSALENRRLLSWIAEQAPRARRLCGMGAGVFLLAAAGAIPGKRVVTHWHWTERLRRDHPDLTVEQDVVFVRDGRLWTGAGMTASIDLTLAMIEEDLGRPMALLIARRLIVFLKRAGGQAQISSELDFQTNSDDGRFAELQSWIREHLGDDLTVDRMAERYGMSVRGFSRAFAARTGTTPAKLVEAMRIEAVQRALEQTALSIKQIARDYGFGDEERMRRAFVRRLGIQPAEYRRKRT